MPGEVIKTLHVKNLIISSGSYTASVISSTAEVGTMGLSGGDLFIVNASNVWEKVGSQ